MTQSQNKEHRLTTDAFDYLNEHMPDAAAEIFELRGKVHALESRLSDTQSKLDAANIALANWKIQTGCDNCFDAHTLIEDLSGRWTRW